VPRRAHFRRTSYSASLPSMRRRLQSTWRAGRAARAGLAMARRGRFIERLDDRPWSRTCTRERGSGNLGSRGARARDRRRVADAGLPRALRVPEVIDKYLRERVAAAQVRRCIRRCRTEVRLCAYALDALTERARPTSTMLAAAMEPAGLQKKLSSCRALAVRWISPTGPPATFRAQDVRWD